MSVADDFSDIGSQGIGCAACAVAPLAAQIAKKGEGTGRVDLSLPGIHCAGCIATVERGLMALPTVAEARVNLSQKRVRISVTEDASPEYLIDQLNGLGIAAQPLESDLLLKDTDALGRDLLMRLAIAGFAMMNVMLLSVAVWSGAEQATRDLFHWLSALIALPTIAFSAQPFFKNAFQALRVGRLNMDVPISLAIVLAAGMSVYETSQGGRHAYFDAAVSLTFFLLIGRYLDHRSRAAAQSAAAMLSALEVPRVTRLQGDTREIMALADIAVGDKVQVLAGDRIPVDGTVTDGVSTLDRSLLTGESHPVAARVGTAVCAGEVNLSGPLTLLTEKVGDDSTLRRMATMIDAAESARNRYTALAERAAGIYAPAVHILALGGFVFWLIYGGDVRYALNISIALLIITCPCALGLAVPAVSTAAAGKLFRAGMLVKDGTALERLSEVDTIVFDKTGTLTDGAIRLNDIKDLPHQNLLLARSLSQASNHPIAQAIYAGLQDIEGAAPKIDDIQEVPGCGTQGMWNGQLVKLGRQDWVAPGSKVMATGKMGAGKMGAWLGIDGQDPVQLTFDSHLRPGAERMINALKAQGYDLQMLSGDTAAAAQVVADQLGLETVLADIRPDEKVAYVQSLTGAGRKVLMVGDGLNDTGALAAAYASVSPASAVDASRAASDVVLLRQDIDPLIQLLETAKSARARVRENFAIAAAYNAVAIPVAMLGFATPLVAAAAMSSSSLTVLVNALRVR